MSLLKIIENSNHWTNYSPMKPAEELAEKIFDIKDQNRNVLEESVFFSPQSPHYSKRWWKFLKSHDFGIQEAEIIAAHYTTFGRNKLEKRCAIRILHRDLNGLDIQLVKKPGSTGVKSVDNRHYDLETTSRSAFIQLIDRVCQGMSRGEDRIRILGRHDLGIQLRGFLCRSNQNVNNKTKTNVRKALEVT